MLVDDPTPCLVDSDCLSTALEADRSVQERAKRVCNHSTGARRALMLPFTNAYVQIRGCCHATACPCTYASRGLRCWGYVLLRWLANQRPWTDTCCHDRLERRGVESSHPVRARRKYREFCGVCAPRAPLRLQNTVSDFLCVAATGAPATALRSTHAKAVPAVPTSRIEY